MDRSSVLIFLFKVVFSAALGNVTAYVGLLLACLLVGIVGGDISSHIDFVNSLWLMPFGWIGGTLLGFKFWIEVSNDSK